MGYYHWANAPSDLKNQIRGLISALKQVLSDSSFLTQADLTPWRFPTPFEFHYSEMWREHFTRQLDSNPKQLDWGWQRRTDPDLAAHIMILHHRGVVLSGGPIQAVFPPVPPADYLSAIWEHDAKSIINEIGQNPVYEVLNLCRVLWYVCEGRVASKKEAGIWAMDALPRKFQELVRQALELYQGNTAEEQFGANLLRQFAVYMKAAIGSRIEARKRVARDGGALDPCDGIGSTSVSPVQSHL